MAYDIGPRIGIQGEKEFNQQIKTINNNLREYGSELKALTSKFKDNATSQEALAAKNKVLQKQLDEQKKKSELLTSQYEKESAKLKELAAVLEEAKNSHGENSEEVAKAEAAYNKQADSVSKLSTALNETDNYMNQLTTEIQKNEAEIVKLGDKYLQASEKMSKVSEKAKDVGDKITSAGKTLLPLSAAAAGIGVAGVKAASDWQSAWVGVTKTVSGTPAELEAVEEGIKALARSTGTASEDIAAVAQAAGQLGVKTGDLMEFTETMVRLGDSTDIASEEASTAIAQLFNITGTAMDQVDNFGAALVELGNNSATSESAIMNMATRIAASGTQVGMTEQQILALATSLSSVGLEAEAGGTAISTVMTNIDKDVATNADSLKTWADTAGMSVNDFKTAWETDAYGAMQKVVQGMSETDAAGGNLNVLLDELGITGIRTSDTMKRLSGASDMMAEMTDKANVAWDENKALVSESDKVYETFEKKMGATRETLKQAAATIGTALMPHIEKLAKFIADLATKFSELNPTTQKIIITIGGIVAAVGPLLIIIGKMATGFGAVMDVTSKVTKAFGAAGGLAGIVGKLGTAFASVGGVITGTILPALGTAIGAIIPFLPIILGIAAAIAGVILVVKNWGAICDWFKEHVGPIIEAVKGFFTGLGDKVGEIKDSVVGKVTELKDKAVDKFQELKDRASEKFESVKNTVSEKVGAMGDMAKEKLSNIKKAFDENGGGIKGTVSAAWTGIKEYWTLGFDTINTLTGGRLDGIKTFFTDKLSAAKETVSKILGNIKDAFSNKLEAAKNTVKNVIDKIKDFFKFEWSLPKLKMPSISITGKFSLSPLSVPKFGIKWNKDGGILSGAQLFGKIGNTFLGGGEAGKEAVLPLNSFYKNLADIMANAFDNTQDYSGTVKLNVNIQNNNYLDGKQIGDGVTNRVIKNISGTEQGSLIVKGYA